MAETKYCWTEGDSCEPTTSFLAPWGGTATQSETGNWTLCVKATDNANNSVTECEGTYIVDKLPPDSPTFNPSSRDWLNEDVSVTVTYTDNLCGVTYTRHCWTEEASCDPGTTNSSTFINGGTINKTENGQWTLCARARDGAGNWRNTDCSGPYRIDKIGPVVGQISPTSVIVNTPTVFSANISDDIRVTNCWLYIDANNDGAMSLSETPCPSCIASKTHTFTSTGNYSLYAYCLDEAGNPGAGTPVTVTVAAENQLPVCSISVPENGTISQWIEINVSGSYDPEGEMNSVNFSSDNILNSWPDGDWDPAGPYDWDVSSGNWSATNKTMKWSFAETGNYEVWAEVKDGLNQPSSCYDTVSITECIPGQTKNCTSPEDCSHTIKCTPEGTWPSCPEDECFRFTEDDPHCLLCPGDRCIGPNWYDYPYYGSTDRAHGNCSGECKCDAGTQTGQPCEPSIEEDSLNCGGITEECSNNIDDDGDGLIDCQDPDCPPTISCDICNHLRCNAFGNYDWTCQPDPDAVGTLCGDCSLCDDEGNCVYQCSGDGDETSCECMPPDLCIDCSDYYDGGCDYQGICRCGPLEIPTWSCVGGGCTCACQYDPFCEVSGECQRNNPGVVLFPLSQSGEAGETLTYDVSVINRDLNCDPSAFSLISGEYCNAAGWTCSDLPELTIPAGQSGLTTLWVTSPSNAPKGDKAISVTAQNAGFPEFFGTGFATYEVLNNPPSAKNLSADATGQCFAIYPPVYLSWTFDDQDLPDDCQSAYQVQIDNNSNFASPENDSCSPYPGTCSPGHSSPTYSPSTGLSFDSTYYWRVRAWDNEGALSDCGEADGWCYPTEPFYTEPRYPWPDFTWSPETPSVGQITQFCSVTEEGICPEDLTVFYDTNPGGRFWSWNFGDGTPAITTPNPTHIYADPSALEGYPVTLKVINGDGYGPCSVSYNIFVTVPLPEWKEILPF